MTSRNILIGSFLPLIVACTSETDATNGDETTTVEQSAVYGVDDRRDWYAHPSEDLKALGKQSVAAIMFTSDLDFSNPNDIDVSSTTLGRSRDLCDEVPFQDQLVAATCSATLIAPDLVATAGHCIDTERECRNRSFVFDYYMTSARTLQTITRDDVYSCSEIVVRVLDEPIDYQIIRLDRPVASEHRPAALRPESETLSVGDELSVIGFGTGLPMKIDSGGRVNSPRTGDDQDFKAILDTFSGNSGSGVFDSAHRWVGILVRGVGDFEEGPTCSTLRTMPDALLDDEYGEEVQYGYVAIDALCDAVPSEEICSSGARTCSPCDSNADCADGFSCINSGDNSWCSPQCANDGACRFDHSCVGGNCVPLERTRCVDGDVHTVDACGGDFGVEVSCPSTTRCSDGECVAYAPGDVCATAIQVPANATSIEVEFAQSNNSDTFGVCDDRGVGAGIDQVFQFSVSERQHFEFSANDFEGALYVRRFCEERGSQIGCAHHGSAQNVTLEVDLDPGTYFLYADSDAAIAEPIVISVERSVACACDAGSTRCAGAAVEICEADIGCGEWQIDDSCEGICWEGQCETTAENGTCEDATEIDAERASVNFQIADGFPNATSGTCGGIGRERTFRFSVESAGTLTFEASGRDFLAYLRTACDSTDEVFCATEVGSGLGGLFVERELQPGQYVLFIDTEGADSTQVSFDLTFVPSCQDECESIGDSCASDSEVGSCRDENGDGCLEFSTLDCDSGTICQDSGGTAECVPVSNPDVIDDSDAGDASSDMSDLSADATEDDAPAGTSKKSGCAAAGLPTPWFLAVLLFVTRRNNRK